MSTRRTYLKLSIEVKRMSIIRPMIAIFVSVGLVLSPIAAANATVAMPAALADQASGAAPSPMDDDCQCCDLTGKCVAAFCSTACVQLGPTSDAAYEVALIGHAALSGIAPLSLHGLAWGPPTPPPRV